MAKLGISIKGVEIKKQDFSPLPDGKYKVVVAKVDVKDTKAGGNYLNVGYQITDGEFKGRIIFDIVNIAHSNPEVVRIGNERLATIAWATGHDAETIEDTDDLINKLPFEISIKTEESNGYSNIRVKSIVRTAPIAPKKEEVKTTTTKKPWSK